MITRTFKFSAILTIGLIMVTLWSAHPLQAATNIKLSGVMPPLGDVTAFEISLDGRYAVYLADQDTDGVNELYSVLLGGGSPVRLNPLLPFGRSVTSYQISPDSSGVVYRANQDTATAFELYSAPLGGPAAAGIKLNGILVLNGSVESFEISPDSSRVVYVADQQKDNVFELYSVPLGGPATAGIKLNGILATNGTVGVFKISPDSSRVVYQADQDTATVLELYSVPLRGPAAAGIKLNGTLVALGGVGIFLISPDSGRVVYRAVQQTPTVPELYSVPIGGPAAAGIKLNGALVAGGNVLNFFQISPDNGRVVYLADQQTNNVFELYSVPLGGPTAAGVKLNGALVAGGNTYGFEITPDSSRVVYLADQQTDNVLELYSVPLGGPAAAGIKLNGALVAGGSVGFSQISPDNGRVVYQADQQTDNVFELYSVPLGGPAAAGIKLNGALVAGGDVDNFEISPDSSRVVYQADQQTDEVFELYSVPLGGPAAAGIKVNGELVTGGNVFNFQISPDSGRVVYRADQQTDEVFELFMTTNYLLHLPLILRQG